MASRARRYQPCRFHACPRPPDSASAVAQASRGRRSRHQCQPSTSSISIMEAWDLPEVGVVVPDPAELPADREAAVRALGLAVRGERLADMSDGDLVKFAHSCDYDVSQAKQCVRAFLETRRQAPEIFSGWDTDTPNMRSIFDVIQVAVVPRRTPDNYRVVINALQTGDRSRYVFADVCRATTMILESIFLTEPTVDGLIVIHDMSKAGLGHFFKFGLSLPKKLSAYTQDGLPLKQQTTHLVRCSGFIDTGLKMMTNFGNESTWERLRVHKGDELSELHRYVPPECLPCDLGGTLPPMAELHDMTVRRLAAFKDVFRRQLS